MRVPLPAAKMMAAAAGSVWLEVASVMVSQNRELARQDSNLECLDQNQVCYRLHHGPITLIQYGAGLFERAGAP